VLLPNGGQKPTDKQTADEKQFVEAGLRDSCYNLPLYGLQCP
jgi:hypothetical protein